MTHILLVKTSSMGDVIHNLTAVSDIKRLHENATIDWLVEKNFSDIPAMHPGVNEVIPVAIRQWRQSPFSSNTRKEISLVKKSLRDANYDYVIDTQGLYKSAFVSKWAGKPVSGYQFNCAREPLATLLYSHKFNVSRAQHAVPRNRQLVARALGYSIDALSMQYGIQAQPISIPIAGLKQNYVVCLHGTSRASKLWQESSWQQLVSSLNAKGLQPILVWGSESERLRSERIASVIGSAMVAPRLGLKDLASLLAGAQVVVGVDTGPIHLAAALGCKTVAIYTDTDPGKTGVLPEDSNQAINLGNIGSAPTTEEVLSAVKTLGID